MRITFGVSGRFLKVLITGAAGFVGSYLTKSVLKDGHVVRSVVRPTKNTSVRETTRSGNSKVRLQYVPEAVVSHAHSLSLSSLWRQHYTCGRGAFAFHRMRAERGGKPRSVEPFSFYLNIFGYPFTRAAFQKALSLSLLLLFSQTAHASGYFLERFDEWMGRNIF